MVTAMSHRPKSANRSYDKLMHSWEEGAAPGQTADTAEAADSSVLWASESQGLSQDMVSRPRTSNPMRDANYQRAEPCSSAYLPEDLQYGSEVLWADISPPDVKVARPCTSNPKREAQSDTVSESPCIVTTSGAVMWASDGAVTPDMLERPKTAKPQLSQDAAVPSPLNQGEAAVLWASEGNVDVGLMARPKAWNKQLDDFPEVGDAVGDDKGSQVLWCADEESHTSAGGDELYVESCSSMKSDVRPSSAPANDHGREMLPQRPSTAGYDRQGRVTVDSHFWEMFETLKPDARQTIAKAHFRDFYSNLEHFGAPHDAVKVSAKYSSQGPDRMSFDEFCIVMLKWSSR